MDVNDIMRLKNFRRDAVKLTSMMTDAGNAAFATGTFEDLKELYEYVCVNYDRYINPKTGEAYDFAAEEIYPIGGSIFAVIQETSVVFILAVTFDKGPLYNKKFLI